MISQEQPHRARTMFESFLSTPLDAVLNRHMQAEPAQAAYTLFRSVAARVPAYRAFLAEQGLDPAAISGPGDVHRIPPTTKQNYILRHSLSDGMKRHA